MQRLDTLSIKDLHDLKVYANTLKDGKASYHGKYTWYPVLSEYLDWFDSLMDILFSVSFILLFVYLL